MRSIVVLLVALAIGTPSALAAGKSAPSKGATAGGEFGFFFEPLLGFDYGSFDSGSAPGVTGSSGSVTGPTLGAQGGVVYQGYFAGARAQYDILSSSKFTGSSHDFMLGLVLGVTLSSAPVRFFVGANFVDNLSSGSSTGSLSADSYYVGAGYFFSNFAVNAEYHFRSYAILPGGLQPSYNNAAVTISMPFTFGGIAPMPEVARRNSSTKKDAGSSGGFGGGDWNI
jgi:hypothetical protein